MPLIPRKDILARFRDMVQRGIPIVGGGVGTGLGEVRRRAAST
jgi:predicted TIM-barrel enzyme